MTDDRKAGGVRINVVGGGLAGSEAAWQIAEAGNEVVLHEMRPLLASGAHRTDDLAELVCFNGVGPRAMAPRALSDPQGRVIARAELREMGSMLMACLDECMIDRGTVFRVDKKRFAQAVTARVLAHPRIQVRREEVREIPAGPTVVATGPMTSPALSDSIRRRVGPRNFHSFEASAPLVHRSSIDFGTAFEVEAGADLARPTVCCPLDRPQFEALAAALARAEQVEAHQVEVAYMRDMRIPDLPHFDHEGGTAVEQHAPDKLLRLVMPPAGLRDPRIPGHQPHAVVRLVADAHRPHLLKLVGFQTKLKHPEQERVFSMIPGLEAARIVRYGHIHMSCFLMSRQCQPTLQLAADPDLFFAGEICGTDTYLAAIGTGWLAGRNAARWVAGKQLLTFPRTTMFGGLCHYLSSTDVDDFQPMVPNVFVVEDGPDWDDLDDHRRMHGLMTRAVSAMTAYLSECAP